MGCSSRIWRIGSYRVGQARRVSQDKLSIKMRGGVGARAQHSQQRFAHGEYFAKFCPNPDPTLQETHPTIKGIGERPQRTHSRHRAKDLLPRRWQA